MIRPWYVVYEMGSGKLVALSQTISAVLPSGLNSKTIGTSEPDLSLVQWDPASLSFVPFVSQRVIAKGIFIQRLTLSERAPLFGYERNTAPAFTDPQKRNLEIFLRYITYLDTINLDDGAIQTGVNFLETVGIIAAGRAAQILS